MTNKGISLSKCASQGHMNSRSIGLYPDHNMVQFCFKRWKLGDPLNVAISMPNFILALFTTFLKPSFIETALEYIVWYKIRYEWKQMGFNIYRIHYKPFDSDVCKNNLCFLLSGKTHAVTMSGHMFKGPQGRFWAELINTWDLKLISWHR